MPVHRYPYVQCLHEEITNWPFLEAAKAEEAAMDAAAAGGSKSKVPGDAAASSTSTATPTAQSDYASILKDGG